MAIKNLVRTPPDSYFQWVRQFPLMHIRDDDHLGLAQELIDQLLQQELDEGGQEYLDALTDLVEYLRRTTSSPARRIGG